MSKLPGFIGTTYQHVSPFLGVERCLNLVPEFTQPGNLRSPLCYRKRGGLFSWQSGLGGSMIRGMLEINGRCFVVAGVDLWELTLAPDGTRGAVSRGTLANDNFPCTMDTTGAAGDEIFIVTAGLGYIYTISTNTLTPIADATFPADALMGFGTDGYFGVIAREGTAFYLSNLLDGTTWDGADIAQRSRTFDTLRAAIMNGPYLWLLGARATEIWAHTGIGDPPFEPLQNIKIDQGCAASFSACRVGDTIYWLGESQDGVGVVFRASGYQAERISTHAIEQAIQSYATIDDARGYAEELAGHRCYVLTFPSAKATWVYDEATKLWHEREFWNSTLGESEAFLGWCHVTAFGRHLLGSRRDGTVYEYSHSYLLDADNPMRWMRQAPHLHGEGARITYPQLTLDVQTGVGLTTGQGSDPQVCLQWSNDGGYTWSQELWRDLGAMGTYSTRVKWTRLGSARNRVFRVFGSDPVQIALMGAYLGDPEAVAA